MELRDRLTILRLNLRYWRPSQREQRMDAIFSAGYDKGFRQVIEGDGPIPDDVRDLT